MCSGKCRLGAFHCKGVVIDRRYLYTGTMNFTSKAEDNEEWAFRHTGPVVRQVLEKLAHHRLKAELWNGRNHVLTRTDRRAVIVNGQSIQSCTLEDGDRIAIGRSRFTYEVRI